MTMMQFIFACLVVYAIVYVHRTRGTQGLIKFLKENAFDAIWGILIAVVILALLVYFDVI